MEISDHLEESEQKQDCTTQSESPSVKLDLEVSNESRQAIEVLKVLVKENQVDELAALLDDVAAHWYLFTGQLGVSAGRRDQIKVENDSCRLCLLHGLREWVLSDSTPTYKKISEVLCGRSVTNVDLAAQVEAFAQRLQLLEDSSPDPVIQFDLKRAEKAREALISAFTVMLLEAKEELKKTVGVSEFLDRFLVGLSISLKTEHVKYFEQSLPKLNEQCTYDGLFGFLDLYWDYLNYNLLESVVKRHGSSTTKSKMKQYRIDIKKFRQSTTLRVFWELEQCEVHPEPPPGFELVKTKHHITPDSTLEYINRIRLRVSSEFHLQEFALYIVDVVTGSVFVTWLVPCSVVSLLTCGLTAKLLDELHIEAISFCSTADEDEDNFSSNLGEKHPGGTGASIAILPPVLLPTTATGSPVAQTALDGGGDAELNIRHKYGETLLETAVGWGHADTVRVLIQAVPDMNVKTESGQTLLETAVWWGHADTVRVLIEAGADVNVKTKSGWTLLETAVGRSDADTVKVLIEAGADVNVRTECGESLLETAVRRGLAKIVQMLIEAGADKMVYSGYQSGQTLLETAVGWGHADTVKVLIEAGADVNVKPESREALLQYHVLLGHADEVRELVETGADVNVKYKFSHTLLETAVKEGHTDVVKVLVEAKSPFAETLLETAVERGHTDVVKVLVEAKADVNYRSPCSGETLLETAVREGHADTVRVLIEAGADMNVEADLKDTDSTYSGYFTGSTAYTESTASSAGYFATPDSHSSMPPGTNPSSLLTVPVYEKSHSTPPIGGEIFQVQKMLQRELELRSKEDEIEVLQRELVDAMQRSDNILAGRVGEVEVYRSSIKQLEESLKIKNGEVAELSKVLRDLHQKMHIYYPPMDAEDLYKMNQVPHGICLIINNYKFYHPTDATKAHADRGGADIDQFNLTQTFRYLRYNVEVMENLTATQMMDAVENMACKRDHSRYDSFVCCILTHGEKEVVHGADSIPVNLNDLVGMMKYCKALYGKPKLFFIQASRGEQVDRGILPTDREHNSGGSDRVQTISQEADFFFSFATASGSQAYRSRRHGSWYIAELCKVLIDNGYTHNLSRMMNKLNMQVSRAYTKEGWKQVPESVNRLRKEIKFFQTK